MASMRSMPIGSRKRCWSQPFADADVGAARSRGATRESLRQLLLISVRSDITLPMTDIFPLRLAEIRRSEGVSQVELARSLGVSQGNLSELENRSDLLLSTLRRFAAALGGDLEIRFVKGG